MYLEVDIHSLNKLQILNIQFYKCFRLFFSFFYSIISACFPGTLPVSSPHYHKTIRCCSQSRSFPLARHQKKIRYHSKHKTKHGFYQQRQEKNKKNQIIPPYRETFSSRYRHRLRSGYFVAQGFLCIALPWRLPIRKQHKQNAPFWYLLDTNWL